MVWGTNVQNASFLWYVNTFATSLSLGGSLLMSYFCLRSPEIKTVSMKVVLAIALSDFLYSIANLMSAFEDEYNGVLCHIEAFIRGFSFLQSVCWATCTSIICYKSIKYGRFFDQNAFFNRYVKVTVLATLCLVCGPLVIPQIAYTNGELLCWITTIPGQDSNVRLLVTMAYGGLPVIMSLVISIFGYSNAIMKIKRYPTELIAQMGINVYKLLWYPVVLILTFVPSTINSIASIYYPVTTPLALKVIYLMLTHSIGFTNAVVYGLQRNLYRSKQQDQEDQDQNKNVGLSDTEMQDSKSQTSFKNSITRELIHAQNEDL